MVLSSIYYNESHYYYYINVVLIVIPHVTLSSGTRAHALFSEPLMNLMLTICSRYILQCNIILSTLFQIHFKIVTIMLFLSCYKGENPFLHIVTSDLTGHLRPRPHCKPPFLTTSSHQSEFCFY